MNEETRIVSAVCGSERRMLTEWSIGRLAADNDGVVVHTHTHTHTHTT